MIYYSNTLLTTPHMTFIGRWSPFHKGHITIINKKRAEHASIPILIMVRDTDTDAYPSTVRAEYIKIWMIENHIKGTIMIIPNVEGVYWGRGVGYNVGQIEVEQRIKHISATHIRQEIDKKSSSWRNMIANKNASYILSPAISNIIDKGLVIWLTGCPSSGKTTIAQALKKVIRHAYPHIKIQMLDGDDMRSTPMAAGVGFSNKERANHILRMAYLAKMFADHGILVICAFVSPNRIIREEVKNIIKRNRFIEVYIHADKKTRMLRDSKGLYRKAKQGKITNLTGFNATYQKPLKPNVVCNTGKQSVSVCITNILTYVMNT